MYGVGTLQSGLWRVMDKNVSNILSFIIQEICYRGCERKNENGKGTEINLLQLVKEGVL